MNSDDQAIFGSVFAQVVAELPAGWQMSIGTIIAESAAVYPYRATADQPGTDNSVISYGETELTALTRLAEAVRRHTAARQ